MVTVIQKSLGQIIIVVLLFAGTAIIPGCKSRNTIVEYDITFDSIRIDSVVGLLLDLNLNGDTILVNQFYGDEFLTWISLSDGKVIKSSIKRGDGPNDMIGPLKVNMLSDGQLRIYDRQGFNVYSSDFEGNNVGKIMQLPFSTSTIFCFNDGKILASKIPFGIDDEKEKTTRFTIFTDSVDKVSFGEYPRLSKSEQDYPVEALAQFHQTNGFCELPDSRFVVLSSHVLSMYVLDNGKYQLLYEKSIAPYDYTYSPSTSNQSASVKLRDGYPKGAKGGIIYHCGLLYFPFYENGDEMTILCYDLNFNFIKKINVATKFHKSICLTSEGKVVAIGEEAEASYIFISKTPLDKL
ncbi:MAG: TolB-like 6-bladed beta-propeller domain-containing protein [Duncaniella sp.]|nr:TolB-like 6-bladed beta-propeller domain-containing protein [Duncaniella sp.]